MADQSAFVIERFINSVLHYWTGRAADSFDHRHEEAIRFARREDAGRVLAWLIGGSGNVVEHMWHDSADKTAMGKKPE